MTVVRSESVRHGEPQPVELMPGRVETLVVVLQLRIELLHACNHAFVRARQHTEQDTYIRLPCGDLQEPSSFSTSKTRTQSCR